MATIGAFMKQADGSYAGAITTLDLNLKSVQFRPIEKMGKDAPDYRIFAGPVELGAAWKKTSAEERDYLSVTIDDPKLTSTLYAALVDAEEGYSLVWSRTRPAN